MKLRQVGAWILILTICLLTGCGQSAEQSSAQTESSDVAKTIGVGVSGDFYPFCYKENDELKGFEIDVWNRIAEENNWKIDYTVADFSGLFGMLDTGKIDTVARQTSSNNETRREKYLFSDVYLYRTYNLVTRADSTLETLDDFKNTKIGVVMGGDGELNLKKLNEEHNLGIEIVGYEATPAMDSDIELGRIDLMKNFSFFEVEEKEVQNVVKALNRANWNGRKVSVEIAGEENGEGRRNGGSSERRGGKRPFGTSSERRSDNGRGSRSEKSERGTKSDRSSKGGNDKTDKKKRSEKPSREERGYGARGPKKTDDWQQFFKDKEPDFSEEGWARRKPKKK